MHNEKETENSDQFVELMTQHQGSLFGYLLSLTGNNDVANDVLQETNVILWKEWRKYEPGTHFLAWARRVAHFQFMTHRQKRLRDRVFFDDDVVASLAVEKDFYEDTYDTRSKVLEKCLGKLPDRSREVIRLRYVEELASCELAERLNRSANAVYQILFRARKALIDCVKQEIGKGSFNG